MRFVCEDCKVKYLKQLGVKMRISIGYVKIGVCNDCCKPHTYLWSYGQLKEEFVSNVKDEVKK